MKRITAFLLVMFFIFCFAGCVKRENRADTSLRQGETYLEGDVESVSGSSLLIKGDDGSKYYFTYSDEVETVIDGWYVVDMSADSFKGKNIKVICSSEIMETFPAQLKGERMIIVQDN